MRLIPDMILFAVFFNIAAVFVAATGFFPNTLYGDAFHIGTDASNLPAAEILWNAFVLTPGGTIISLWGNSLTFKVVMALGVVLAVGIGFLTKGTNTIAMALVGYVFFTMYTNSKTLFDTMLSNMDSIVQYLALMVGVGVLIMFVILMMDYASGQAKAG